MESSLPVRSAIWTTGADYLGRLMLVAGAVLLVACGGGGGAPIQQDVQPTGLQILSQPSAGRAYEPLSPVFQVVLTTSTGARLARAGFPVEITIQSGPAAAVLYGSRIGVTFSTGIASFSNLSVSEGGSYVLRASAPGVGEVTFAPVLVTGATGGSQPLPPPTGTPGGNPPPPPLPPSVTQLAFGVSPSKIHAREPFAQPITVELRDSLGALVPNATARVSIYLDGGAPGSFLTGLQQVDTVAGVATFPNLSVATPGASVRLWAIAQNLPAVYSTQFQVLPELQAQHLIFSGSFASIQAGQPLSPEVTVQVVDANGIPTMRSSAPVFLFLEGSGGGELIGRSIASVAEGKARFRSLSVNQPGSYQIRAHSPGHADAFSNTIVVLPPPPTAYSLRFVAPIASTGVRRRIGPIRVELVDQTGSRVTGVAGIVSLRLSTNPGSAVVRAGATVAATGVNANRISTIEVLDFANLSAPPHPLAVSAPGLVAGMARDAAGIVFALTGNTGPGPRWMVQLDPDTGMQRTAFPFGVTAVEGAVAFDDSGRLLELSRVSATAPHTLRSIDTSSGVATQIASIDLHAGADSVRSCYGLASDAASGQLFALVALESSAAMTPQPRHLVRVDPDSGDTEIVAELPGLPRSLTAAPDGFLYAIGGSNPGQPSGEERIWRIAPATGQATQVATAPLAGVSSIAVVPARLRGTLAAELVAGVATFDDLMLDCSGLGFVIEATSPLAASGHSVPFNVSPAVAAPSATLSFASAASSTSEGAGRVSVSLALSEALTHEVAAHVLVSGNAWAGRHHDLPGPIEVPHPTDQGQRDVVVVVRIPPGSVVGGLALTTIDDGNAEASRVLTLRILRVSGAAVGATDIHDLMIYDND